MVSPVCFAVVFYFQKGEQTMKKLIIPLILCIFLCGCYDFEEIDNMAYVIAIGIDKGEEKALKVSFQYALPLKADEKEDKTTLLKTIETDSILTAQTIAESEMAKTTELSHLKLVLFSEEIARLGILPFKRDLFESLSLRPDTYIAVCEGKATDTLNKTSSPLEKNPSRYYEEFFMNKENAFLKHKAINYLKGNNIFNTPFIRSDNSFKSSEIAVFKDNKLSFVLNEEETSIYSLLKSKFSDLKFKTKDGIFKLDCEIPASFSVKTERVPKIKISVSLSGEAVYGKDYLFTDSKEAEKYLKNELKQQIFKFIDKTKEKNCDILSLSSHAKRLFLTDAQYKNYDFLSRYKNAEFDVEIIFRNTRAV